MADGCVHLLYKSCWKFRQLAAGPLLSGPPVQYRKGKQHGFKITPAGSLSSSQPGGPPCWASPLAFGLIGCDPPSVFGVVFYVIDILCVAPYICRAIVTAWVHGFQSWFYSRLNTPHSHKLPNIQGTDICCIWKRNHCPEL
jgi:hypothetical protein